MSTPMSWQSLIGIARTALPEMEWVRFGDHAVRGKWPMTKALGFVHVEADRMFQVHATAMPSMKVSSPDLQVALRGLFDSLTAAYREQADAWESEWLRCFPSDKKAPVAQEAPAGISPLPWRIEPHPIEEDSIILAADGSKVASWAEVYCYDSGAVFDGIREEDAQLIVAAVHAYVGQPKVTPEAT